MAATRAKARGYTKTGRPANNEVTRLGGGYVETEAASWRTMAISRVHGDGSGTVEVLRDGKLLHAITFGPEDGS